MTASTTPHLRKVEPSADEGPREEAMLDMALDASFPASDPAALGGDDQASMTSERGRAGSALSDLASSAVDRVASALNGVLADVFALYLKTKNFHWHMAGPHFRDYHLLLDEHGDQLFAMTDPLAERVRKLGRPTLRSIGQIARTQRIADNDEAHVGAGEMLAILRDDNGALVAQLRAAHAVCDESGDVASASLIENWIDETERRIWFLAETHSSGR
jgi:starvation-inducible DNA-binding protein